MDIRDYEDNEFYSKNYGITEEYVRFDIERMQYSEKVRKEKKLKEALEPFVTHRELDENKPPQFFIPTAMPRLYKEPLVSAECNLGHLKVGYSNGLPIEGEKAKANDYYWWAGN